MVAVRKVGGEPGDCRTRYRRETVDSCEDGVVDGVQGCTEVKQKEEDGERARVCGEEEEEAIGDFLQGCFSSVVGTEAGLECITGRR